MGTQTSEIPESINQSIVARLNNTDIPDSSDPILMASYSQLRGYLNKESGGGKNIIPLQDRLKILEQIHTLNWSEVWNLRNSITDEYFSSYQPEDYDRKRRYINLQAVFATCNDRINFLKQENIKRTTKTDPNSPEQKPLPQKIEYESGFICYSPERSNHCATPLVAAELMSHLLALGTARANEEEARKSGDKITADMYMAEAKKVEEDAKLSTFELQMYFEGGFVCNNCHFRNLIPPEVIKKWESNNQKIWTNTKKD